MLWHSTLSLSSVSCFLFSNVPVDNAVHVEVLQTKNNAGSVETGSGLLEDVLVYVHHQVSSTRILHHEAHVTLRSVAGGGEREE